jgi:hypothetical protein
MVLEGELTVTRGNAMSLEIPSITVIYIDATVKIVRRFIFIQYHLTRSPLKSSLPPFALSPATLPL